MRDPNRIVQKHEVCVCGHCRCVHGGGFAACTKDGCVRYTWPGVNNDLPPSHPPNARYKARVSKRETA